VDRTELYEGAIKRIEEIFPDMKERRVWLLAVVGRDPHSSPMNNQITLHSNYLPEEEPPGYEQMTPQEAFHANIMGKMHETLVYSKGQGLFAGSEGYDIREGILEELLGTTGKVRTDLFRDFCEATGEDPQVVNDEMVLGQINPRAWHPSSPSAKRFCRLTDFDQFFAGEKPEPGLGHYSLLPWKEYPRMREFQKEVSSLMTAVLESDDPEHRQGIMVLPTGAGKTRVAAETLLKWYLSLEDPPLIVWLCHRNELCSQAHYSFESVWNRISIDGTSNPHQRSLEVYRFWGESGWLESGGIDDNPIDRSKGGLAIVSIQTLGQIVAEGDDRHRAARESLNDPGCLVVDEVHRFETKTYRDSLGGIGVNVDLRSGNFDETRIGLTATPWQSDPDKQSRMYRRWGGNFLLEGLAGFQAEPADVERELDALRSRLQGDGILAKPNYYTLPTSDRQQRVRLVQGNLDASRLSLLANDLERNTKLLNTVRWLIEERGRGSILLFGVTKRHAMMMSVALNKLGILSASVDADTPSGVRRGTISKFITGELRVLCNHSIFTTGFDAPNTDAIVICRPIRSKTLLDQIFGRGLRGKEFKGTEDCDIVVPNDRFEFSDGTTRQFVSFAVPEDDIGRMLGTKVEEVPESEED